MILNHLKLTIFIFSMICCNMATAQRKSIPLNQADPRFTITAERHYAVQNEEYWFYIQNNTNEEYELVVNITINSTCHEPKNFNLHVNGVVTLKPGGKFTPASDWVHIFLGGSAQDKCRKKDGNSHTYLAGISYKYTSIKNVTQEKLKEEREKKLREEQKLAEEKKKAEDKRIAEEKKKAETQIALENKKAEEQRIADERRKADEQKTLAAKSHQNSSNGKPSNSNQSDDFWSDGFQSKSSRRDDNAIPEHSSHKNLPDLVRTTDGGFFEKGADGRFREITADEYAQARRSRNESGKVQEEEPQMTTEDARATLNKMFADAQARNDAINLKIEQKAEMWRQNFYHAEAVRQGKQNLADISRLSGNFNSVAELEAEFNQKYYAIRYEVNNLEQARNAQLSNAVAGTFNENSTEQAIGEGVVLIGTMVNNAKAEKEAKAAQEALKQQRERHLAEITAAKKRALLDLRTKLIVSFPDGGTPISSHKITAPEVYMFAYITDKTTFDQETSTVYISNIFPVHQYSDGTFPYKINILDKFKAYGPGSVTLVGYYADQSKAEEMRKSFLNLAKKSNMVIKTINLKTATTSTVAGKTNGDFWETGNVENATSSPEETDKKVDDFWNN